MTKTLSVLLSMPCVTRPQVRNCLSALVDRVRHRSHRMSFVRKKLPVKEAPFSLGAHLDEIDDIFSRNSVEEIVEALHHSGSSFAKQALKAIQKASPTSLKVFRFACIQARKLHFS